MQQLAEGALRRAERLRASLGLAWRLPVRGARAVLARAHVRVQGERDAEKSALRLGRVAPEHLDGGRRAERVGGRVRARGGEIWRDERRCGNNLVVASAAEVRELGAARRDGQ